MRNAGAQSKPGPLRQAANDRRQQSRSQAFQWLEHALNKQLVILTHGAQNRSMVASGISIDYLVQLSESLRNFPMLSVWTHTVARDVVSVATEEQKCRFVDVVPQEHVGYATYYICHNWNADFHDLVAALATEFNRRWQAYVNYRSKGSKDPVDEAAMVDEKRNLVGYYVWMDVFSLNQHVPRPQDLTNASRLIHVIGRTVVVVDEDCTTLSRLWCLFEIWCTIKHKGVVITHTTSPGRQGASPVDTRRASAGGGGRLDRSLSISSTQDARVVRRSSEGGEDSVVLAPIDVSHAKTTVARDRQLLLASLQSDVDSRSVHSMDALEKEIHACVVAAQEREAMRARQVNKIYEVLNSCGKVYAASYLQPQYTDLHTAHGLAQSVVRQFYEEEHKRAKLLSGEDVEMELWECVQFLAKVVERYKEEDYWGQEFKRYANLAQRSFATRFSNAYVDNLLRQAGTFDDMGALAQYVHRQCKRK